MIFADVSCFQPDGDKGAIFFLTNDKLKDAMKACMRVIVSHQLSTGYGWMVQPAFWNHRLVQHLSLALFFPHCFPTSTRLSKAAVHVTRHFVLLTCLLFQPRVNIFTPSARVPACCTSPVSHFPHRYQHDSAPGERPSSRHAVFVFGQVCGSLSAR